MKASYFVAAFLFSWGAWAVPNLNQKIHMTVKNMPPRDFISQISKKTQVSFIVDGNTQFKKNISLNIKGASLKKVLDTFAQEQGVSWKQAENDFIKITPKD